MFMMKSFIVLLAISLLHRSVHAAGKVRISISKLSGQFINFPLAHKRIRGHNTDFIECSDR